MEYNIEDKRVYSLTIIDRFKNLVVKPSRKELKKLEKSILTLGCKKPIIVWEGVIVDGHSRYEICQKYSIPFAKQDIDFDSIEEAEDWICARQLEKLYISDEYRWYYYGKRMLLGRILDKARLSLKKYDEEIARKTHYSYTASRLGNEYNICARTITEYEHYARAIDSLKEYELELVNKVLTGEKKVTQASIIRISKEDFDINNRLRKLIDNEYTPQKFESEERKPSIKDMPVFDPDAELSSLIYTIPTWIQWINRTIKSDLERCSDTAKDSLKKELHDLKYSIESLILIMEETNDRL